MGYLRPLGDIERGCWLIDQTAPMNVVAIAALRGRLDLARLADALACVQRRHPLLRACVQIDRTGPAFFASEHAVPIAVMAVERPHMPSDKTRLLRGTCLDYSSLLGQSNGKHHIETRGNQEYGENGVRQRRSFPFD